VKEEVRVSPARSAAVRCWSAESRNPPTSMVMPGALAMAERLAWCRDLVCAFNGLYERGGEGGETDREICKSAETERKGRTKIASSGCCFFQFPFFHI